MNLKNAIQLSFLTLLYTPFITVAQGGWLSTPESIQQFRQQVEKLSDSTQFEVFIEDKTVALQGRDIPIRIYKPFESKDLQPALIYVHGACFVAGSLDSHDEICRYLALKSGVMVIAIDYRLAPEHKYPAAHDDVYEVSNWIWQNAKQLGINRNQLAIGGESAGAYFAAATALKAIDMESSPKFAFQLLVYAALDGGGGNWKPCKNHYFNSQEEQRTRYGSPVWADKLSGLPPTYNIYGEWEISRAEEELFMRKLVDAGVVTTSYMHAGVAHDVMVWGSVQPESPAHLKAIEFIREGFANKGTVSIEKPVKKQRPLAYKNGKIIEKDGKKWLYGGKDSLQHFDISHCELKDEQFHYGIGRERFPALLAPEFTSVVEADAIWADSSRFLLAQYNGDIKAYSVKDLTRHEIVNDELGGQPIMAAYCILADLGAIYERTYNDQVLTFALSGYTYYDEKVWNGLDGFVFWDRDTESLWWPLIGRAVSGSLKGVKLLEMDQEYWEDTTWGVIKKKYPTAQVLQSGQDYERPKSWKKLEDVSDIVQDFSN